MRYPYVMARRVMAGAKPPRMQIVPSTPQKGELPFPGSGGVFDAFLQRIRFSPNAQIDIDWLVNCLGISQRPNAGKTLHWLQLGGFVDSDGFLTNRGECLLHVPSDSHFQDAAREALHDLIGEARFDRLKSGKLTRLALRDELCTEYEVGVNSANKAIVGFCVLAEASRDPALVSVLQKVQFRRHVPSYPEVALEDAKAQILAKFELFRGGTGGIDGWLKETTPEETFLRLMRIPIEPLSAAQLNQLLTLDHAPPLSSGFFTYYWLSRPDHTYNVQAIPEYNSEWEESRGICALSQLYWGLYRFYVDALLYFGNVRAAYQILRTKTYEELVEYFGHQRHDPDAMISRGPALPLHKISKDDRYLISEMACKSYAPAEGEGASILQVLPKAYRDHRKIDSGRVTVGDLLNKESGSYVMLHHKDSQSWFEFSVDEILDYEIQSEEDLLARLTSIETRFIQARDNATTNTALYLSSVGELDVYVATSMRKRREFHAMADFCDRVFGARQLRRYDLRYFDPTLSAATNHEDKGLIECLMVNCAKVLVYTAGEAESYGKDAEAAMALSQGKPVVFFCTTSDRQKFYKEVHPLSRLVDFQSGVAVGAIVTDSEEEVVEILDRLFKNAMQYTLEQKRPGYLVLREAITGSVVRLQTSDVLLRETFWNHYHMTRGEHL